MYERILDLIARKERYTFNPEGMRKVALNYYFKELQELFDEFKNTKSYDITTTRGFFDYMYSGKSLEPTPDTTDFLKKIGVDNYNQLRITNSDGKYEIIVWCDRKFNFQKHLRTNCKIKGYKIKAKNRKEGILVTEITPIEPRYDFEEDTQFTTMAIENVDDVLSLFPAQTIANREEKQKALLFSLIGAQEKNDTRGGIGASILTSNPKENGVERLLPELMKAWYPSCTRGKVSSTLGSFLGGYDANVMAEISDKPINFLRYKINRDIIQLIPKVQRDPQVFGILSYVHSYIYLDDEIKWLEQSNSVDMLLFRARSRSVRISEDIIKDAKSREDKLNKQFYDDFNRYYRLPEAVLDVAECLAKISGRNEVSVKDLQQAENNIYVLRHESADEIGEHTKLFEPEYRDKTGEVRTVYTLIGIYGESHSRDELKQKAAEKGVRGSNFDKIIGQLIESGEIYLVPKDGVAFVQLTSREFHIK